MKRFSIVRSLACLGLLSWQLLPQVSAAVLSYQPEEIRSVNGKLEVTLTLDYAETVDGRRWSAVYNGLPIGPTLRVQPGDFVSVTLVNALPPGSDLDHELYDYTHDKMNEMQNDANMTVVYNRLSAIGNVYDPAYGFWGMSYANIHFHGADVPASVEMIQRAADGGETITYNFTIPDNQEPGLMWYHQHFHGVVATSYMGGQYGFFVIEGTEEDITKAPGVMGATEVFMMLSEFLPSNASQLPSPPPPFFPIAMSFDWLAMNNGHDGDRTNYQFDQGETVLFRVAHAGVEPTILMKIGSHTMTIIGYDGFPVPEPMEVDTVEIGTGQRVEFLVHFSTPGTFTMVREAWDAGGITGVEVCTAVLGIPFPKCISYDIEKVLATIEVTASNETDASLSMDAIELPPYNAYHQALAAMQPVDRKTVTLDVDQTFPLFQIPYDGPFVPPGIAFGMNGRLATPFQDYGTVQAGTCETWDVVSNPPGAEHTFHIHASDFLVTHQNGVAVEKPFWRDTLIIDANATIHVCFDRVVTGDRVLFHCHMPSHQDTGMAGFYAVIDKVVSTPAPTSSTSAPTKSPTTADPTTEEPTSAPASGASTTFVTTLSALILFITTIFTTW